MAGEFQPDSSRRERDGNFHEESGLGGSTSARSGPAAVAPVTAHSGVVFCGPMSVLELLRRESDVRTFPAGATIFAIGDAGDCMYVVLEGEVSIERDGKLVERCATGSVFGEMALI